MNTNINQNINMNNNNNIYQSNPPMVVVPNANININQNKNIYNPNNNSNMRHAVRICPVKAYFSRKLDLLS